MSRELYGRSIEEVATDLIDAHREVILEVATDDVLWRELRRMGARRSLRFMRDTLEGRYEIADRIYRHFQSHSDLWNWGERAGELSRLHHELRCFTTQCLLADLVVGGAIRYCLQRQELEGNQSGGC